MEGLRLKSLMLFWFWKDFGGGEAEVFDFLWVLEGFWKAWGRNLAFCFGFGRIWERIPIVFEDFWKDFEGFEAEVFDFTCVF